MEAKISVKEERRELYLTFPDSYPTSQCIEQISKLKKSMRPYLAATIAFLAAFAAMLVIAAVLFGKESTAYIESGHFNADGDYVYSYRKDYAGAIACAVLAFVSLVGCILCGVRYNKYRGRAAGFNACIKINRQYTAFIEAGYDKKEAYRLTLEWIDRQGQIAAVSSAGEQVAASVAMTGMLNINK